MNKIYKLVWNVAHGEWVVCSELGRKTKLGSLRSSLIIGALLLSQNAISAECSTNANGTITVNNSINTAGCSVESIGSEIGNTSIWNTGILQYSQGVNRNITILNDLSFTIKGSAGIAVGGTSPAYVSTFDASNKTIDLTIANLDTNAAKPEGDNIAKVGVGSSHGATVKIGTMNLTMLSLPNGTSYSERFEHYGVVAGSSVNAGEQENFNGMYSRALFDNLDINMASTNNTGFLASSYPLVVGIRAIQGASRNSGNGAAGYVSVSDTLNLNIKNGKNDAIGIYISGSEINNVTPQVHLHDSNIKIVSSSSRANAIRLGKSAAIGTGEGQLYSSGKMFLDTTEAPNDASIDIIWQGALLDANENTSRTEIKSGKEAITISGNASQATAKTITNFNNLIVNKTGNNGSDLINVAGGQNLYQLSVRGEDSNLISNNGKDAYILDVAGSASSASNVLFNFSQGRMQGLINTSNASKLDVNIADDATWQLEKNASSTTASFTTLNLNNSSLIAHDVNNGNSTGNNSISSFTLKGNVLAKNSEIDMANGVAGDHLTIDGNFTTGGNTWLMDSYLTGEGVSTNNGGDGKSYTDTVTITGDTIDRGYDYVWINNLNMNKPTGQQARNHLNL